MVDLLQKKRKSIEGEISGPAAASLFFGLNRHGIVTRVIL